MTALLWARYVLIAAIFVLLAGYVWAERRARD